MPCSLRGTNIEALHNPIVGISIMSQFLVKNLFGQHAANPNQQTFQKSLGTYLWMSWNCQGRTHWNRQKWGSHRFPYLCHPRVWASHRPPLGQSFPRKPLPREPKQKVGRNYFRHTYLLPRKSNGKAAFQSWLVRGGEVHFPVRFTILWNETSIITLTRTQAMSPWPSGRCSW